MINALVVVDNLDFGGVAQVAKNFSFSLSEKFKVRFDYICYSLPSEEVQKVLRQNNSNFRVIPRVSNTGIIKQIMKIGESIDSLGCNYSVIHIHTSYFIWISALVAKRKKITKRIGHAHGSIGQYSKLLGKFPVKTRIKALIVEKLGRILNRIYCTHMISCADESSYYTFGRKVELLPNIVKLDKFRRINQLEKETYSNEFHINKETKVVGYVGTIGLLKNTTFLVNIFVNMAKKNDNNTFILVGDGPDLTILSRYVEKLELSKKIIFTGHRKDTMLLLQVFDVLVMPSLSEGMSLAILEAQILGTPVIVSPKVPVTNDIGLGRYYQLNSFSNSEWYRMIVQVLSSNNKVIAMSDLEDFNKSNFSEEIVLNRLYKIYKGER